MCELFGVCGPKPIQVNEYLKNFKVHSLENPHGWGLAIFYGDAVNIEKEPRMALESKYLEARLSHPLYVRNMLAHIRMATMGKMFYENCHPFVRRDNSGRAWTLIHNGTLFEAGLVDKYKELQEGNTDSERILYYLVDMINEEQERLGRDLTEAERFGIMDRMVCALAPGNKLNLMVCDGELMYVHTNRKETLYQKREGESILFATKPLDNDGWELMPFTVLEGYKDGKNIFTGTLHGQEFIPTQEQIDFMESVPSL